MLKKILAFTCLALSISTNAATFDFESVGSGLQGSTLLALPEGTFVSSGTDIFLNGANASSICAVIGTACDADLSLTFNGLASNISFEVIDWGPGDSILVSLFDSGSNLLESTSILGNGIFSFPSVGVASMFFDNSSTDFGTWYANWSFDIRAVPAPPAAWLFGSALLGLGVVKRRKAYTKL